MIKLNLKKIITMGLIATSILAVVPVGASAEWRQNSNGWWYTKANNTYATGWEKIGNSWYYFDSTGYMKAGWVKDGNNWYFLKNDGTMATGTALTDGQISSFTSTGVWNGYIANNQSSSNTSIVQANSSTQTASSTNDDFTLEQAMKFLNEGEQYYYCDGIRKNLTFTKGGFNGLAPEDKVYTTSFDGRKYRLVGVIDKVTGEYYGIAMVVKNFDGTFFVQEESRGSYSETKDGVSINELTFDKAGTWKAYLDQEKADKAYLAAHPNQTVLTREQIEEDNLMNIYAMHPEYKVGHEAEYKALEEKIKNRNR